MATPIWLTGFEYGVATPTANGTGLFNVVTGTPLIQGTNVNSGNYALQITSAKGSAAHNVARTVGGTFLVGGFYFKYGTATSGTVSVMRATTAAGASPYIMFDSANKQLFPRITNDGAHSEALTANTWYRVDFKADVSTGTSKLDLQVNGTAVAQGTLAQTATTFNGIYLGWTAAVTGEFFYDDVILSNTAVDYPIGEHVTQSLVPNADGAHNAGANVMEDNTGADIGVVTAYDKVSKNPLNSGTTVWIRQNASGTGNYAAVLFGTVSGTVGTMLGAEGILCYNGTSSTANNGQTRIYDSGTNLITTVFSGDMSETSLFYKAEMLGSGLWGTAALASCICRFGYSNDASPKPIWNSLMIEYAYLGTTASLIGTVTPAEGSHSQSGDAGLGKGLYTLTTAEGSHSQSGDASFISYLLKPEEGTQSQTGDAATTKPIYTLTTTEGTQSQSGDASTNKPIYLLSPTEGTQSQSGDPAGVIAITVITPAEGTQAQLGDSAVATFYGEEILPTAICEEGSQSQTGDPAVLSVIYRLTVPESTQSQSGDPSTNKPVYTITVAEGAQSQTGDPAVLYTYSKITVGEGTQTQSMDSASVSFSLPVVYITPDEGTHNQIMDWPGVGAVYVVNTGEGFHDQQMDAADAQLPFTPPSGLGTRRAIYADARAEVSTGRRKIYADQHSEVEAKRG